MTRICGERSEIIEFRICIKLAPRAHATMRASTPLGRAPRVGQNALRGDGMPPEQTKTHNLSRGEERRKEEKKRRKEGGRAESEMPDAAEGGWHQTRAAQAQPDTHEGSTKYSIGRAGGRAGRAEAEARHGHTPQPQAQ